MLLRVYVPCAQVDAVRLDAEFAEAAQGADECELAPFARWFEKFDLYLLNFYPEIQPEHTPEQQPSRRAARSDRHSRRQNSRRRGSRESSGRTSSSGGGGGSGGGGSSRGGGSPSAAQRGSSRGLPPESSMHYLEA